MAKTVTTFNDLSSELILCIFEYLSVADRYKAFFDCNTCLRQHVKRWTSYSRKELDADILRFSTLHSWYKMSVRDGGVTFFIYPHQGQQPYNSATADADDVSSDLHWWFIWHQDKPTFTDERVSEIVHRHSFQLTPFFYHRPIASSTDSDSNNKKPVSTFYGGDLIMMHRDKKSLESWLKNNYPEHADRILNCSNTNYNYHEVCAPVFEAEWLRLTRIIKDAAFNVWEELKQLQDLNPLEIHE